LNGEGSPTREQSPAIQVIDDKYVDKLVDFDDDEDYSGLPAGGHDYQKRKTNRNKNRSKATTIEMSQGKDQDSESRLFHNRNQA